MELSSLQDLFFDELNDLYSAENQIIKALPKMAKAATSDQLRTAFEEHLEQTRTHVERLEQIFDKPRIRNSLNWRKVSTWKLATATRKPRKGMDPRETAG